MSNYKITKIEEGYFIKLFNRNGYVLDFSTPSFDCFTTQSVGIPLCQKYGCSKGMSLECFLSEADNEKKDKLLYDLFRYYEINFQEEIEKNYKFRGLYKECKRIINEITDFDKDIPISVKQLKVKFSSSYIDQEIDLMMKMQKKNPTEAIGKAKELIESCCKTILEKTGEIYSKHDDMGKIVRITITKLKIAPEDIPDNIPDAQAIKSILGNLSAIAKNIAQLRNSYGTGHGKSASYKGLEERHAKLAVGSSIMLVHFLWDSYERMRKDKKIS